MITNEDDVEKCLSPHILDSEIDLPLYNGSKITVLEAVHVANQSI